MTPIEIQQAVEIAIKNSWGFPWWSYILCCVFSAFGAFGGFYLKAKATNFATQEDFKKILEQLKEQVAATENIKTEISFSNWKKQEWSAVRRLKLEELVSCAYELRKIVKNDSDKLGKDLDNFSREQFDMESDALLKLQVLTLLYFPELKVEMLRLNLSFRIFQNSVIDANQQAKELCDIVGRDNLTDTEKEILNAYFDPKDSSNLTIKIPYFNQEFTYSLNALSDKVQLIMHEIIIG